MGFLDPGMAYYRAISDGEDEAIMKKARQDAMRAAKDG